ncbi:tRNA glutamyl-Q(34) synthetase GluQRS [Stappia sp. TSB10P1A]|uniref:tRNA glutamyl-Q(34) synthetase GluQRS n=1 Tax=Stappia sp. TSB10P1A TaxID=2003585 RepID=UPI001643A396|nr:tRNA glutamyl-Q(34) synthetase GluQRS [Stappia sp. TSB10P1A]
MSRPVLRFAPSPNGRLHLGHALSALLNARMARALGGRLLVRIEDIDAARCTPELEAGVLEDLAWLGLDWERPVRRQSEHFSDYRAALDRLSAMGLLRKTFLTRGEIARAVARLEETRGAPWPCDPDGAPLYPGDEAVLSPAEIAARAAQGAPFALRLDMRAALGRCKAPLTWQELPDDEARGAPSRLAADPARWGDVVLARKDTPTSYHLSVVVDDARQGVTHVVRGRDLYEATAVHRLLQVLLGLPEPLYRHHRLILDADGRKLSKSQGDTALAELRARGATPDDIRRRIGLDPDA